MIITRTPFRISFFGGGTDYPAWYREHGGAVLSTSINKYCYVTCRHLPPFFEHKHRIVYSKIEIVKSSSEIEHPSVRAILEKFEVREGLEIHYDGDLPARSGIGSSSSFSVGLINAIMALKGNLTSPSQLVDMAIHIEQEVLRESVGSQDQIAAAFGGFNRIDFYRDGSYLVTPVVVPAARLVNLNENLLLFFSGISRYSSQVAKSKIENFSNRQDHLFRMHRMVDEALSILQSPNRSLDDFGYLLRDSWELKKSLSDQVSTDQIESTMKLAFDAGALGGKVLGAGGGGFILFYATPDKHEAIRTALSSYIEVDFSFGNRGSQIVHYDPETAIYQKGPINRLKDQMPRIIESFS